MLDLGKEAGILGHVPASSLSVCRTEIFSGKAVTHEDIKYEQACILYNLGEQGLII